MGKGWQMKPKGFWSYARGDDEHLDQMLSTLRARIAGEVSMLMGEDIGIFQDIHDLRTGDRWEDGLRKGLNKASFLIPVLTPRFFNRDWCREEVLTYLRLSQEAGLEPRIFPVKFVEWDEVEGCEVRAALQPFQYKDLSNWRFESDPTQKNRLVYEFGKDVKTRLKLPVAAKAEAAKAAKPVTPEVRAPEGLGQAVTARDAPPPPKQKVHVVDAWPKRGDFTLIQAAIDAAEPGDRIVVREGTYRESLRLSKVLEIVGEGDREKILVVTGEGDALHCDAPLAKVSGMRFRREAGGTDVSLWITGGAAEVEDCIFESLSLACVEIKGSGTSPTLRRCVMRNGAQTGMMVHGGAQVVAEECQFTGNAFAGVEVVGEATRATLHRCTATQGREDGFYFHSGAGGVLERCESVGNGGAGVHVATRAKPVLRDCDLRDNVDSGLLVISDAFARVDGGLISGNENAGVNVGAGSAAEVAGCMITGNGFEAVWIRDAESSGTFRDNDLRGNRRGAWDIAEGAKVTSSGNLE